MIRYERHSDRLELLSCIDVLWLGDHVAETSFRVSDEIELTKVRFRL